MVLQDVLGYAGGLVIIAFILFRHQTAHSEFYKIFGKLFGCILKALRLLLWNIFQRSFYACHCGSLGCKRSGLVVIYYFWFCFNWFQFIGATMGSSELHIQTENGQIALPSNICCVVVEYLPGGALKTYLIKNRRRKLAFKVVVQLALDLARGYLDLPYFYLSCVWYCVLAI